MSEYVVGNADQRVFLAEHPAILTDKGQTVDIGVDDDTQVEASLAHTLHDTLQVLLQRFGVMGELTGTFAIENFVTDA